MIQKVEYIVKHNALIQRIFIVFFSCFFRLIGKFVKKSNKQILFQSLIGKNYGDSPRVLFEAIKKDPDFSGYKFVWAFDDPDSFDVDEASKIKLNSLEYFITALKSSIWITNVNIERGLHFKPSNTIYINTWHGCAPLKIDGNAQKNRNDYDFSDVDILCSNSEWQDDNYITYYNAVKNSIIRCGMPRNDALYDVSQQEIEDLRKKYGIPLNKKVILYAPTWRESLDSKSERVIAPPIDIKYWEGKLSSEYIIIFRMHHLTKSALNITFNDFVRDFSGNYDVNDLMKMADILVSDYSSIVADFSILERPVLFFAYDYKEYCKTRGLYVKLEELLPGCVHENERSLIDHILHIDFETESIKVKRLKEKYVCANKNSSLKCLTILKEKIRQQKN